MIDGLIAGKVYGQPQSKNDTNGKPYAFGKVRTATASGDSLFVSVIVFGDAVRPFMAARVTVTVWRWPGVCHRKHGRATGGA